MSDDLLQIVVRALQSASRGEFEKIKTSTGIDRNTIYLIKTGRTKNPRWDTLKAIADYFGKIPQSEIARRETAKAIADCLSNQQSENA